MVILLYLTFFFAILSFYFKLLMFMKHEFHYGEDAIMHGVSYVNFITYTRVKINVHPTHDGHSYTM